MPEAPPDGLGRFLLRVAERRRRLGGDRGGLVVAKLLARWLWERGLALGLAVLALYVALAPPYVTDGDNGEFSTLSATGGVAHPSGYPLYVLWLRAMSWLPGQSVAHTAAIATAILAAALVVVLHAACRAWGARTAAATAAALVFAIGPIVVKNHVKAEVFALNGLVVAAVLWLSATGGPLRGAARTLALGLVAGLGISDHLTCVLAAPIGLLGAVRGVREATARGPAIALGVAGLVVGLLPYLYLFAAPASAASWGSVDRVSDLLHVFLREDYGGAGAFRGSGTVDEAANLGALFHALARGWLWVLLPIAVVGWGRRIARKEPWSEPRAGWIMLAVAWLLAGPLLVLRFDIEPIGFGLAVCERFYLLPLLLLAVPVAVGLDDVFTAVEERMPPEVSRRAVALIAALGVGAALVAATPSIRRANRVHTVAVEQFALNLLASLPQGAVLIGSDDATYATILYLQETRGVRTDVVYAQGALLALPWYAERIARRGVAMAPGPRSRAEQLALGAHGGGRPVFVDFAQAKLFEGRYYPHGVVLRILPPGARPPPLDDVVRLNGELFERFEFPYELPGRDDELVTAIHKVYAEPWTSLAGALAAAGRRTDAEAALARARAIGPQD